MRPRCSKSQAIEKGGDGGRRSSRKRHRTPSRTVQKHTSLRFKADRKKEKASVEKAISPKWISRLSRVPLEVIERHKETRLLVEKILGKDIIGQDDTVAVARGVRHARLGLTDANRPRASFYL